MDLFSHLLQSASASTPSPLWIDTADESRNLTWDQHVGSAKSIAVRLREAGVKENACVAIVCRNDIWYPVLASAIMAAGAIYAGVYPKFTSLEITRSLETVAAEYVFVEDGDMDRISQAAMDAGIPKTNIWIFDMLENPTSPGHDFERARPTEITFSSLLQADPSLWEPPFKGKAAAEVSLQPCVRGLTSGTTSSPKAAELTHENCIARCGGKKSSPSSVLDRPRALHSLAMSHQSGTIALWETLLGNQATYVSQEANASVTIQLVRLFKITNMTTHPRHVEDMTAAMSDTGIPQDALHSLRQVSIAGGPISPKAMLDFKSFLLHPSYARPVYGSTEAGTLSVASGDYIPGYMGSPPSSVTVTIRDPDSGVDIGKDQEGEICASGPGVFHAYANNEAATKSSFFIDGEGHKWHRTGDRGRLSSEKGQLAVTGRYKETFKVSVGGGYDEVAPEEVEAELLNHEAVSDVAVTHVEGRKQLGDLEPAAYIVLKHGMEATAQEMVDHVARRLSKFKAPTGGVFFVNSLPRIGFGKVARRKLIHLQERGEYSDSSRKFLALTSCG